MAVAPEIALAEVLRHSSPQLLPRLNEYRLTEISVSLSAVLDFRDAGKLALRPGVLVDDYNFETTQALAAAAVERAAEAMLVPSATGLGDNIVVFPSRLYVASKLRVVGSRDPRLHVSK
jgi:hypothetical protein